MYGPFDRWPDAHPAMLSAQERASRAASRKLARLIVWSCILWAIAGAAAVALVRAFGGQF